MQLEVSCVDSVVWKLSKNKRKDYGENSYKQPLNRLSNCSGKAREVGGRWVGGCKRSTEGLVCMHINRTNGYKAQGRSRRLNGGKKETYVLLSIML